VRLDADRYTVLEARKATGFPALATPSGLRLEAGIESWTAKMSELFWREDCAAFLRVLGRRHLLTASPLGRRRTYEWVRRCRQSPSAVETQAQLRQRIFDALDFCLFGDRELDGYLTWALERVPPMVREFALRAVYFAGHGFTSRGSTTPPIPIDRPYKVDVTNVGDDLGRVCLHELAHCWHATFEGGTAISAVGYLIMKSAAKLDRSSGIHDAIQNAEHLADLCEAAWAC
jgi:hypothetical protein